jgi:hypothetical protein
MHTYSFNRYVFTVTDSLLVTIVTKTTFCNLLVTKKRKQPDFSNMRNYVTFTIFWGAGNGNNVTVTIFLEAR